MGAAFSMPRPSPAGHTVAGLHSARSELAPAQHKMVELIDRHIDTGNYARAAELAATCKEQAPTTKLRRRFTGLLLFAISRLETPPA